jgi:pimeloyl-ACP methyl ester carboxylesterase
MRTEIQEHDFDAGAITINYAELSSDGSPLVLLHGGSGRWQSFEEIIPTLAAHWHIFAPDLRGHGKSSRASSYQLQGYVNDLIAFLDGCVKEPTNVFGHSLGGIVALMAAAQRPNVFRALIVGDSPLSAQSWQAILN